ncbi:lipopolysaccharide biosynthesis protein [Desulfolucanica intricata]|uniref:lipopolysaccharide biosynthesis protein n=1 Tax=Desulfolucanica intricata TaxID=1285191 RepID=UPI00082F3739|nr:lipopolysaccharide biosynthesis protein [Desulfolucanica intricata]
MGTLRARTITSIKWTATQTAFVALSAPIFQLIQARFLSPNDFAHLSIVMIFIGLFNVLGNFGISQAIIQRDTLDSQETSTLFLFNIFLSCFLGILIYFLSPLIAHFFNLPDISFLIKLTIFILILDSPSQLCKAFLQKKLLFKDLSVIAMVKNISMILFSTIFLIIGLGVLGIIIGNIISVFISTVLILITGWKRKIVNCLCFKIKAIYPFLNFGLFVIGKQVLTHISVHIDEIIVGLFLSPEILGVYYFGKNMLEKLRTLITASFSSVLYPVLSKLKYDNSKQSLAYNKISNYIATLAFPVFVGIALTSHLFIPMFFGQKWTDSIIVFQVFSLALIPKVLTANLATSLLYSVNKPNIVFNIEIVTNLLYFVVLYFTGAQGLNFVLLLHSLYIVSKTIILQYFANKLLGSGFWNYILGLKITALATAAMVIIILSFQKIFTHFSELFQFTGSVIIGALCFIIIEWLFDRQILIEIKSAIYTKKVDLT